MLRGVKSADTPKGDRTRVVQVDNRLVKQISPTEQSLPNSASMLTKCPGCGEPLRCFMRPRYFYSEEPGSVWSDFLDGLPRNRCTCGLKLMGSVSSFHTDTWTAVTLEPPGPRLPGRDLCALVGEV